MMINKNHDDHHHTSRLLLLYAQPGVQLIKNIKTSYDHRECHNTVLPPAGINCHRCLNVHKMKEVVTSNKQHSEPQATTTLNDKRTIHGATKD